MLLRCLQANSSFEEEWATLGGPRLQTGLRQGEPPGQTGRLSMKGTFEGICNSVCFWRECFCFDARLKRGNFSVTCCNWWRWKKIIINALWGLFCIYSGCVGIFYLFVISCPSNVCVWFFKAHTNCFLSLLFFLPLTFPQKLFTGHSAWIQRRWTKPCAGAPKKTCWGRRRATLTSLLHFMTLLPAGTTRSASLKVNCGMV